MINEELDLTLQYHDELNPKLWVEGDKLKPIVREHLLKIAKVWAKTAKIEDDAIEDIIITGGNVNYNYTKQSDIDVHLVVDMKKTIFTDEEQMRLFMLAKKDLWALQHDVKIYGLPVEVYAHSHQTKTPKSQGVYSIYSDNWTIKPKNLKLNFNNDVGLKHKIEEQMHRIDSVINGRGTVKEASDLKDKLAAMRATSIQMAGEFAIENLVFKDLRNRGYIDKLKNYIRSKVDRMLTLR